MSELFHELVNAQKEKNFQGSHKLQQAHKKVCNEMKGRGKSLSHKNVIDGRKHFIRRI